MKTTLLLVFLYFVVSKNLFLKAISYIECKSQCDELSLLNHCYCDKSCSKYDDCCELNSDCKTLLFYSNTPTRGTCCRQDDPCFQLDCFCDPLCFSIGDCCPDIKKCQPTLLLARLPRLPRRTAKIESDIITISHK